MRAAGEHKTINACPRADALPPGTPQWITMDLVRETIRVWQPYYSAPISLDDAVTILSRIGQLFSVLSEK
jgi:hypothetical protein